MSAPAARLYSALSSCRSSSPWLVEEERGNYTEWSYRVSFECGPRCAGGASVRAAAAGGGAPSHGHAPRHTVRLELVACSHLPLLPWPKLCGMFPRVFIVC